MQLGTICTEKNIIYSFIIIIFPYYLINNNNNNKT